MTAEKQNSVKGGSKRLNRLVAVLACLCVLVTGYLMMQPALSMNIEDYAANNNGSVSFTLTDTNNSSIPKDENGNFEVTAGTTYKLSMHFNLPDGILPGTYEYQLPSGLVIDEDSGDFILGDGTNVGSWTLDSSGNMSFVFNQNANKRTEMTITAEMGIHFSQEYERVDFDGYVKVVIYPPEAENQQTELQKWGVQGGEGNEDGTDPNKIYWTVEIKGHEGSSIPSSVLTDTLLSSNLKYTNLDMSEGIRIGVSQGEDSYHEWYVRTGDPGLSWTETNWSYTIPEVVKCNDCGADITLTNNNTVYYVKFTSTADNTESGALTSFGNRVMVDGKDDVYWGYMGSDAVEGGIVKTGNFVGDKVGGRFNWTVSVVIPGKETNSKPDYAWNIYDGMKVTDSEGNVVGTVGNDIHNATITAIRNGEKVTVPEISKATASDDIVWNCWVASDGVQTDHTLELLYRCTCTEDTCARWTDGACNYKEYYTDSNGVWTESDYCYCWNVEDETTLTINYDTQGVGVVDKFGGKGYYLDNVATLANRNPNEWGEPTYNMIGTDWQKVSVPGMFKKELSQSMNGYVANYTITVNEAKTILTTNGDPLLIHDEMTDTLAYMNGSLVITTEDAEGKVSTLKEGVDYTAEYDGSGNHIDAGGNSVHVLDINILYPMPVTYILNYDTAVIIPNNATGGIPFNNSATVTLAGQTISSDSAEKIYSNINVSAKHYKVEITKKDSQDDRVLAGAEFGLYNKEGGLITSGVTDENGKLLFETSITDGIILREHTPYYIQEIDSPDGYVLEDKQYWFCFCEKTSETLQECNYDPGIPGILKVPADQIAIETITNTPVSYVLPDAGGGGARLFVLSGLILVIGSAAAMVIRRRRQYNM